MEEPVSRRRTARVEAALWIVMGVLAFLTRDNPNLVYPHVLYLFLALLASSLGTSLSVRTTPDKDWLHALTLLTSLAAVAGIQEWSGGAGSSLWVLYLLPLFTSAILLERREVIWTAIGACAANAAISLTMSDGWSSAESFELALKTGILASAAGATWLLSRLERDAEARSRVQRVRIERLEGSLRGAAATRERERGVAEIAAGGAGAVHDLATPLIVVRAYATMHLEKGVADEELSRDLKRIESAAAFCQELVTRLLSRAGAPASPRRVDAALEAALALAEPVLARRRVSVACECPQRPLTVLAGNQDLERVLLNLIGNAAKVMAPGGKISLTAARAEDAEALAVITVDDEGPGIPADVMARLFEPFTTTGGTGLGLYASRTTARRLGGDLSAENRPDGGARFTLRLPLVEAPAPAVAAV